MKSLWKQLSLGILICLLLSSCGIHSKSEIDTEGQDLVILHTNDFHGHPVPFFNYPAADQGGLAAQATLVNEVRGNNENVLVLSAGDINTGRPESNFFKAEPDIIGHNYIGYDALSVGNHEFDPSPQVMQQQIKLSDFPWLCANVVKKDGQYIDNVKPYILKSFNNITVAIFGLVYQDTAKTANPNHVKLYTFLDEVKTAKTLVPELKKKADIVIALVHMGLYKDENRGSKRLAKEVSGIDLIIDGHTHTKVFNPIFVENTTSGKSIPIVQAGSWGLHIGKIELAVINKSISQFDYNLIPINVKTIEKNADGTSTIRFVDQEIMEDQKLSNILEPYNEKVDLFLSEVIGFTQNTLTIENSRVGETPIANMVADSMLWYSEKINLKADFAIQNGGGIRTGIPKGEVKKRTIYESLPFDNTVVILNMKGADVLELFNSAPTKIGRGGMIQVSRGVSYKIQTNTGTISDLTINGKPINPEKIYKIATISYLAQGGDGYDALKRAREYYDTSLMQRDVFIQYVTSLKGILSPTVEGRITIEK